jgi:hypothetical protein
MIGLPYSSSIVDVDPAAWLATLSARQRQDASAAVRSRWSSRLVADERRDCHVDAQRRDGEHRLADSGNERGLTQPRKQAHCHRRLLCCICR